MFSHIKSLYTSSLLCLILFLFQFSSIASQQTPLPLNEYYAQMWDSRDGLPHNGINDLAQSADGYLWVATWEGLARFNGREFTIFTRGSEPGLPDSGTRSLFAHEHGDLLVAGARGGVSERKNRIWHPSPATLALVNAAIYDENHDIWLGLEEKGLVFRDNDSHQERVIIDNISINNLALDKDNVLWVASDEGLYSVKNKHEVIKFGTGSRLPDVNVFSVMVTRKNQLIVGTNSGVFTLIDGQFKLLDKKLSNEAVSVLLEDSNDDLWIGTTNHGVFRLSEAGLEQLDDNAGLPGNRIFSLFEDKERSIWIGTNAGLFRLRKAPFITLTSKQGLAGNYIRSVLSHSDGSLWVGSSKGLNKIVDDRVYTIPLKGHRSNVSILSLAQDNNGGVLAGTYTDGVYRVIENQLVPFTEVNKIIHSNEVRSILVDSKSNTWFGTSRGVVKLSKDNSITFIDKKAGLPANFIMALAEDSLGNIWIGTGVGVASYADGVLKVYRLKEQFDAEYAFGFYTTDDALWMATDRGILRLDNSSGNITALTRKNGLPIDKYFQVLIDDIGAMWLTSNRGIIKITADEVNKFIANDKVKINYQIFTEGSGLLSAQANGGSTPAAQVHGDGSIWIATANGVSQLAYERLNAVAEQEIPVTIEKLMVDGKSYAVNKNQSVTLPAGASNIAIYYAGLGFLNAENIQYQTFLSGLDNDWLNKNNQTYTEYTNLKPGAYVFNMRARYPDGQWRDQVATLSFNIEYFYWQTNTFKVFVVFLFCGFLYSIYRLRLVNIQQNEDRLEQLVTKQTLELKEQAKMFSYQASHDQLTGLPNRRAFDQWSEAYFAMAKAEQLHFCIAVIDIDHFKRVNDHYSHLIGDQVLISIADILTSQIKGLDNEIKLARWGGEEFTLLLPCLPEQALSYCQSLCRAVKSHDFSHVANGLTMTISIGVADNHDSEDYDKMLSHADQALYCAKYSGRDQVQVYSAELAEKTRQNMNQNRRKYD